MSLECLRAAQRELGVGGEGGRRRLADAAAGGARGAALVDLGDHLGLEGGPGGAPRGHVVAVGAALGVVLVDRELDAVVGVLRLFGVVRLVVSDVEVDDQAAADHAVRGGLDDLGLVTCGEADGKESDASRESGRLVAHGGRIGA
jgi:hypothetical protein